jgi:hypothetical protein
MYVMLRSPGPHHGQCSVCLACQKHQLQATHTWKPCVAVGEAEVYPFEQGSQNSNDFLSSVCRESVEFCSGVCCLDLDLCERVWVWSRSALLKSGPVSYDGPQ